MTSSRGSRDVTVITPWYPMAQYPFRGSFVRAMVAATAPGCDSLTLIHCDDLVSSLTDGEDIASRAANLRLAPMVAPIADPSGVVIRSVSVPIPHGSSFADTGRRQVEAVAAALGGRPISSPIVHGHVGLAGGLIAASCARPDARVFVTEHASFVDRVLAEPAARDMYEQVVRRAERFFVVGERVRQPLVEAFPDYADKFALIANPVAFHDPSRTVTELHRWVFAGSLVAAKGVGLLLEAFAKCRADMPGLTLTFIGDGALTHQLTERTAELGIADAVTFTGPLSPDETLRVIAEHDLLVHPSRFETFGMTIIEAISAGLPVLVTRCGGPETTLAGIETAASEFIDVTDSPDDIVAGYRRLRDRFPGGLDIPLARRTLGARYGYSTVAAAHHRAWFADAGSSIDANATVDGATGRSGVSVTSDPIAPSPVGRCRSAYILAVGGNRRRSVESNAADLVAGGADVTVIVGKAMAWFDADLPDGVAIVELPFSSAWVYEKVGDEMVRIADLQRVADRRATALVDVIAPNGEPDLIVVTDPRSIPVGAALIKIFGGRRGHVPRVVFGLTTHVTASDQPLMTTNTSETPAG